MRRKTDRPIWVATGGLGDLVQWARYLEDGDRAYAGRANDVHHARVRWIREAMGVRLDILEAPPREGTWLPWTRLHLCTPLEIRGPYMRMLPFERGPMVNIGVHLQGNAAHPVDLWRSAPAHLFDTMMTRARGSRPCRWTSIDRVGSGIANLWQNLSALDVLIAVDSAPAHVAGAMGKPVILLQSCWSDARWGPPRVRPRTTSLYPNHLIVQSGDPMVWPVEKVADLVADYLEDLDWVRVIAGAC